jgi:hypothetical protein
MMSSAVAKPETGGKATEVGPGDEQDTSKCSESKRLNQVLTK